MTIPLATSVGLVHLFPEGVKAAKLKINSPAKTVDQKLFITADATFSPEDSITGVDGDAHLSFKLNIMYFFSFFV